MEERNVVIKLENVDFYYDKGKPTEVRALKEIDLDIKTGDYVSFFGPSGCGKSTILYVIAGVEKPESGRVLVNNQDLMTFSPRELAIYRQVAIGIIFQNFNLIPSVRNIDNVTLPMAFLGISPERRRRRAMEILGRLDIDDLADRFPHELSGGQQQRVAIARAMANDPPIILADEPLGNLDTANATNVLDLLRKFKERDGKTIVMVTHEAWSLRDVDRVFYMRDGAIIRIEERKKKESELKKVGTSFYYKKLFPELADVESRAKAVASLMLRGHSKEEVKRLEFFLVQLMRKNIEKDLFKRCLDRPFKNGGVGLWRQKANKIADYVEEIIQAQSDLSVLYKKLEKFPDAPLYEEISNLRKWLIEGYDLRLTPLQMGRLNEIIGERIRNIISAEDFKKILDLSKDKGGVGLKIQTSLKMAEKLETFLGKQKTEEINKEVIV
ncbi:MAG: ABC transporter ATP-binding protein [Patescibacteria group bacterium]